LTIENTEENLNKQSSSIKSKGENKKWQQNQSKDF
jgi:hypothetical protein